MAQEAQEEWLRREASLGLEWGNLGKPTSDWARWYVDSLVAGLIGTSRRLYEADHGDMTQEEIDFWLAGYFSETRAELIASTETTSGFWHGQEIMAGLLILQGFRLEPVWNTQMDERVCTICAPNHGLERRQGWTVSGLPAHPRCRCFVTWKLVT